MPSILIAPTILAPETGAVAWVPERLGTAAHQSHCYAHRCIDKDDPNQDVVPFHGLGRTSSGHCQGLQG